MSGRSHQEATAKPVWHREARAAWTKRSHPSTEHFQRGSNAPCRLDASVEFSLPGILFLSHRRMAHRKAPKPTSTPPTTHQRIFVGSSSTERKSRAKIVRAAGGRQLREPHSIYVNGPEPTSRDRAMGAAPGSCTVRANLRRYAVAQLDQRSNGRGRSDATAPVNHCLGGRGARPRPASTATTIVSAGAIAAATARTEAVRRARGPYRWCCSACPRARRSCTRARTVAARRIRPRCAAGRNHASALRGSATVCSCKIERPRTAANRKGQFRPSMTA